MSYDALIIGEGLSGLTANVLLAKRGLKADVTEQKHEPCGSCGIFKLPGVIFDHGFAMLYGFGEQGSNTQRFVFK
jgi:phytoene dehydrogenase-like protein